jgi:hypothetical protein
MPTINQKDVFNRPPPGVRKIVIATNIAETRYVSLYEQFMLLVIK